jgi:hypothetical protein
MLLLLFATFFFMSLTPIHTDDCQHAVCEYCQEIVEVENVVNAALEEHSECLETVCETCVFIEKQIEQLGKLKATEHSCQEVICDVCARITLGMRLQLFVCVLTIFALVYATTRATSFIIKEKTLKDRAFTLFALRVRLND